MKNNISFYIISIIAILIFIVFLISIYVWVMYVLNNTKETYKKKDKSDPYLDKILKNMNNIPYESAPELFDKIKDIQSKIYKDHPDIGGVLVHLMPLESIENVISAKDFKFDFSIPGSCDCSETTKGEPTCSAWTYLRKDLPPVVFSYPSSIYNASKSGKYGDGGYWTPNIGIIVDPKKIWPLITTMGVTDSGTDARNCGSSQFPFVFDKNSRCRPVVYENGKKIEEQSSFVIYYPHQFDISCNKNCLYDDNIINQNCRYSNAGASFNSNYFFGDRSLNWDCPSDTNRGIINCWKAIPISWNKISEEDRKMLLKSGYNKNNKFAIYIPRRDCYLTSPSVYITENTPSIDKEGKIIGNTSMEINNNGRNYLYVGENINSNISGPNFSQSTWKNCEFKEDGKIKNCKVTDQTAISMDNILNYQFKWYKKDWARWINEIKKLWSHIYYTLDKNNGYKDYNGYIDGLGNSSVYSRLDWIYGNPCNKGQWWENEVNIYVNPILVKDTNSSLNKIYRESILGFFYIGKTCEDFTSSLPTGTNAGDGCIFENKIERCIGYLCNTNINKKDPLNTKCIGTKNNGENIVYNEVKNIELKRMKKARDSIIKLSYLFNKKYRIPFNKNNVKCYKLLSYSNAFPSWDFLDKMINLKTSASDVLIEF